MRVNFSNLVYENERDIFNSLKNSFPAEFNPYLKNF